MAIVEPPEPVGSKGLAPQGLSIPNLPFSISLSAASLIHRWDLSQSHQRVVFLHIEGLFEPAELFHPALHLLVHGPLALQGTPPPYRALHVGLG